MLLLVNNRILTLNRAKTWLTAATAVGATSFTVKAVNSSSWASGDYVIVGEIGTQNAEVLKINASVSSGTALTLTASVYAHSIDEPVYRIDYNQVKFYRSAVNSNSSAALLSTVNLMPNSYETRYEDSSNDTGYGFARFFNSNTNGISPFSDGIPYTGQSQRSLAKMVQKVRTLCDEEDADFLTDDEIADGLNERQRDILNERLWTFNEVSYSASSVQYQFDYDKPSGIKTLHTVRFGTEPLRGISQARWEMLHWDTNQQTTTPSHVKIFNEKVSIYPTPQASANTSTLNGAITSSATSIVVADVSGFEIGDYYRFIIDSEVIYATYADSSTNTFSGCMRAQEGTTAVAHLNGATVTERDIVFTGQAEPVDLLGLNDETIIPESLVICHGTATDFCLGKLNKQTLGDRYQIKYKEGIESLRNKYTLKLTSQFGRVRDPREVVDDNGRIRNPNDFPSNVTAT